MAARRSPLGSGPASGATNPHAPAPASRDRLSQLEKQMAEIRDGTIRDVLEKLLRFSCGIEDINGRFVSFDRTGEILDVLGLKVYRQKAGMVELRIQDELGSAPSPPLSQQAGNVNS